VRERAKIAKKTSTAAGVAKNDGKRKEKEDELMSAKRGEEDIRFSKKGNTCYAGDTAPLTKRQQRKLPREDPRQPQNLTLTKRRETQLKEVTARS